MLIERQHEGSAIGTPDLPIPSIDECGHHDDTDHDTATCQGDRPCGQGEGSFFDEDYTSASTVTSDAGASNARSLSLPSMTRLKF